MVYMSSSGLDYSPIVKGWIGRDRQPQEGDVLQPLFEASFAAIYRYFSTALTSKMEILECMIVSQVIINLADSTRSFSCLIFLPPINCKGMQIVERSTAGQREQRRRVEDPSREAVRVRIDVELRRIPRIGRS